MEVPDNFPGPGKSKIVNNILYLLAGSAISQGLTSFTLLLTARLLGPQSYGQYTSTLTLATFASILFNLGLNTWGLHEASRNPKDSRWILGSLLSIKFGIGLLWCGAMFILSTYIDAEAFPKNLLRMNVLVVWIDSLFSSLLLPLKVNLRNQLTSIIMVISDVLWFCATLALVYIGIVEPLIYIEYRLFILVFSVLLTAPWIVRLYQLRPRLETIRSALRSSFPYASSEILLVSMKRIDVLMVAVMLDSQAIGIYAPAVSILNALLLLLDSASNVMIPVLSNSFTHKIARGWHEAKRFVFFQALAGLALMGLLWAGMGLIGVILGESYSASIGILKILSPILVIHSFVTSGASIYTSTNQQSKRSAIQAVAVGLNIALNILAILAFGIIGAAVVYVVTELFLAVTFTSGVLQFHRSQVRSSVSI